MSECHEEFGEEKEILGSTLPWTACIEFVCMPLMAECHEDFGKEKEKLDSTLPWMACI